MLSCGVSIETGFSGKEGRVSAGRIFRSYNVEIPDPEDCVKVLVIINHLGHGFLNLVGARTEINSTCGSPCVLDMAVQTL